jgi:transposase
MHYDLGEADEHARWTFSRLRFMTCLLKDELRRDGHWDDFTQELYATAYQAWQQGLDMDQTRRYASRRIHAFLKAYGYRAYRNSYIRQETAFSASFPDWQTINLPSLEKPRYKSFDYDVGLKEGIVRNLSLHSQGMTRSHLSQNLEAPVTEIQRFLDSLIKEGKVIEVKREHFDSRLTPLYLMAGSQLPAQYQAQKETYERIRRAHFVEGLSMSRIAQEYSCHWNTVQKIIRSAPPPPEAALPFRKRLQEERYATIRRLYFEEGKSTRRIAAELHHSLETVARAIHTTPTPAAYLPTRELVPV